MKDRTVSIRRSWFSHSLCVFEHSNDITEFSPLQQATALNHRWCGWSELPESSVCLWQKVRPPPEITTFSSCDDGYLFRGFYEKIDKVNILWAVFMMNNLHRGWWTTFKTEKKKKKINSFRVVPAHQLSSCDVGGDPGVRGLRQHTGALFTPRPKMTNSINSRHLSRAPMDPNIPDRRLKGFFLVALTADVDIQYQYLGSRRITFHLTSMVCRCGKE